MAKKKKSPEETLANIQAAQLAAQVAQWAAQLEFNKERMRLLELPQFQFMSQMEIDKLAFQKSEAEYKRALEEASLTGTYKGQPTLQYLETQARLTGVINGQQTLEGRLTDAQIAQMNHQMQLQSHQMLLEDEKFGFERERWGAEFTYQQQQDLRNYELSQAGVTGYYNGGKTLDREQMEGNQANQYLSLMASLQSNPFKQARVLGNTPNGLRSVADAWAGKFQMAGQSSVGAGPGPAQFSDLTTQFDPNTGQPIQPAPVPGQFFQSPPEDTFTTMPVPPDPYGMQPGMAGPTPSESVGYTGQPNAQVPGKTVPPLFDGYQYTGGIEQAPAMGSYSKTASGLGQPVSVGMVRESAPMATTQGYIESPPGVAAPTYAYNYQSAPGGQTQVYPPGVQAPVQGMQVSTATPQSSYAQSSINPGKINARNYANTNQAMKDLGWMQIEEEQGISQTMAKDAFKRSLPKYGGPKAGRVAMAGAA